MKNVRKCIRSYWKKWKLGLGKISFFQIKIIRMHTLIFSFLKDTPKVWDHFSRLPKIANFCSKFMNCVLHNLEWSSLNTNEKYSLLLTQWWKFLLLFAILIYVPLAISDFAWFDVYSYKRLNPPPIKLSFKNICFVWTFLE